MSSHLGEDARRADCLRSGYQSEGQVVRSKPSHLGEGARRADCLRPELISRDEGLPARQKDSQDEGE